MAGKKFAAEFALRRNVSALDKILIQDSDDNVVKYAYPPQIASLSGYAYAQSVADLPLMPPNKSIGYIVGQMLYIYVGMGGDTKDGLYQSVGFFVGPQGVQGEKGEKGERGEQGIQGVKGDNGGLSLQEIDEYLATKQYVTADTLAEMLEGYVSNTSLMRDYVTIAKAQDVTGVKNFTAGVQFGGLSMYKSKDDTVYLDANLVVRGGVTAFGTNETVTPSIFDALPIDGVTLKRTENGVLYVASGGSGGTGGGSLDEEQLEEYLKPYAKTADVANTYATKSSVNALSTQLNDFLSGSDTDTIINKWSELETFLAGLAESDDLATILSGKANKATTLAGYGITDAYTKSHIDSNFVTIGTKQRITGEKDFVGGFKVNGGLVEYNATLKTWVLNGDLLVTGGVAAFSNIGGFKPSTITDAVLIDDRTIKRNADGLLYAVAQETGGINGDQLEEYLRPYATQDWVTGRGYITALASITGNAGSASKLQNAVSLWGRSFDGTADLTGSLTVTTGEGYRINYNGYDLRFIVSGSSSRRGIWDNTNNEWMMYRSSSTNIIFPQGNIAIGSHTTPTDRLTVVGSISANESLKLTATPSGAFDGAQMLFAGGNARIGVTTSGFMGLYASSFTFRPSSTTTASSSAFTIDANANISTTGKLTLPIGSSNYTNASLWFGDSVRIGVNSSNSLGIFAGYAIRLNPDSASSASTTKGLWLLNSGFNGVNNTSPTEALDVVGNIKASGKINVNGGILEYDSSLNAWTLNGNLLVTGGVSAFSNISGFKPSTITDAVLIDNKTIKRNDGGSLYAVLPNSISGDLGITGRLTTQNNIVAEHSSNPFLALKRDGTTWYCQVTSSGIKLGQGSAKSINVDASGNLTAPGSITPNTSSDKRLKQNIRKFNAGKALMSLGGVYQYEYIDSEVEKNHIYAGTHYGLIYQHVKGTTLDVMCHEREDGMGALNYIHPKFISLIAGATMESISEVEKLKRKIRHLENKVKQLEQRA